MPPLKVFIGFDARERRAYEVCAASLRKHASIPLEIQPLVLEHLRWRGVYTRPHEVRDGRLWDVISDAPMSTEFALTRFCVPVLAKFEGMALYCDCDFLWRSDVADLLMGADPACALSVVQHILPPLAATKMDGQAQQEYERKLWSSLMLFNCSHAGHVGQAERVARWPGLWLQQLAWLQDRWVGWLERGWNWLEGCSTPYENPRAVHFTRGTPDMPGYENSAYADEWRQALEEATCAPANSATA